MNEENPGGGIASGADDGIEEFNPATPGSAFPAIATPGTALAGGRAVPDS